MPNKQNKIIILIFALIIIVGIGSYFAYGYYNETQTKNHMVLSKEYSDKGLALQKNLTIAYNAKNYTKYLKISNNQSTYFFLAISEDKKALKTDNGKYKDYINYDIDRLKKDLELSETQRALINTLKKNDFYGSIRLSNQAEDLSDDAHDFKDKQKDLIDMYPNDYAFLNE